MLNNFYIIKNIKTDRYIGENSEDVTINSLNLKIFKTRQEAVDAIPNHTIKTEFFSVIEIFN